MECQIVKQLHFDKKNRNALLFNLGIFELIVMVLLFGLLPFDQRDVFGVSPWLKPIKFAVSFGLFLITMAYFIEYLQISPTVKSWIAKAIALFVGCDLFVIILQSLCEQPYHFNLSTPLSASICYNMALFFLANFFVTANSLVVAFVFVLFFRKTIDLPKPYLWAIRIGLGIFLISCFQGGFIAIHNTLLAQNPAEGNLGLPFISENMRLDLRTSHFVGVHSLQAVPIVGYLCRDFNLGKQMVLLFGTIYLMGFIFLFLEALSASHLF